MIIGRCLSDDMIPDLLLAEWTLRDTSVELC